MKTFVQRGYNAVGKRDSLEWVRVRNSSPRGLIFVPPLIGGSSSQQVNAFRWLIRRGLDLVSFSYAGHGRSSNKFSIGASMRDTTRMLAHACRLSAKEQLSLFGIGTCYSAIPLLRAAHKLGEPVKKIVLVNAIPALGPQAVLSSFLGYYRKLFPAETGLIGVRAAVGRYVDNLFPGISKGNDYFGVLELNRARISRTITEFFTLKPLKGVRLGKTAVLCLYARKDPVLQIYDRGLDASYQNDIRRVCPQSLFRSLDGDHFLSLPKARGEAAKSIMSFFTGRQTP